MAVALGEGCLTRTEVFGRGIWLQPTYCLAENASHYPNTTRSKAAVEPMDSVPRDLHPATHSKVEKAREGVWSGQ